MDTSRITPTARFVMVFVQLVVSLQQIAVFVHLLDFFLVVHAWHHALTLIMVYLVSASLVMALAFLVLHLQTLHALLVMQHLLLAVQFVILIVYQDTEYLQHLDFVYYVQALALNAITQIPFALNVFLLQISIICLQLVQLLLVFKHVPINFILT